MILNTMYLEKSPESLDLFLIRNRLSKEDWRKSDLEWQFLIAIASDYSKRQEALRDSAEFFAKSIQRIPCVHSVRWRLKDVDHVLAKIVRKKAEGVDKYKEISIDNYQHLITDLIGLRALHLFKDECLVIDEHIGRLWHSEETPLVYIREGDTDEIYKQFEEKGHLVRHHKAGYRSVHYIVSNQPLNAKVFAEIQVRTIFEEGWSEIDHRVRYPNYSNDQLISYFLGIFNRLAGNADEMGTFVRGLAQSITSYSAQIAEAENENRKSLVALDDAFRKIEELKEKDVQNTKKFDALQADLNAVRRQYVEPAEIAKQRGAIGLGLGIQSLINDPTWIGNVYAAQKGLMAANPDLVRSIGALGAASEALRRAGGLSSLKPRQSDD